MAEQLRKVSTDPVRRAEMRREARAKTKTEKKAKEFDNRVDYKIKNIWSESVSLQTIAPDRSKGYEIILLPPKGEFTLPGVRISEQIRGLAKKRNSRPAAIELIKLGIEGNEEIGPTPLPDPIPLPPDMKDIPSEPETKSIFGKKKKKGKSSDTVTSEDKE